MSDTDTTTTPEHEQARRAFEARFGAECTPDDVVAEDAEGD